MKIFQARLEGTGAGLVQTVFSETWAGGVSDPHVSYQLDRLTPIGSQLPPTCTPSVTGEDKGGQLCIACPSSQKTSQNPHLIDAGFSASLSHTKEGMYLHGEARAQSRLICLYRASGRWPSGMGKAKYGSGGKNQSGSSLVRPPLLLRESSFWQTSEPGLGNGLSIHHSFIQQKWNEGHLNFRPCNMLAIVITECLNSISVYRALFTKHILSFDPHGNLMMTPLLKLENWGSGQLYFLPMDAQLVSGQYFHTLSHLIFNPLR